METRDPSMYKRLQYAKEILIQMINKNQAVDEKNPMIAAFHTTDNRMSERPAATKFEKTQ